MTPAGPGQRITRPLRRLKNWYLNLEDGSLAHILVLLGAFAVLVVLGVTLNLPQAIVAIFPLLLINPHVRNKLQKSRPEYSLSRASGKVRTRSVMTHPRFSGAVSISLANLGKRLWTPSWIGGVVDFTHEGVKWDPAEGHLNFGFNPFTVPWSEIQSVELKRHWFHGAADWGYLRIFGKFGPPVDLYLYPFRDSRRFFDSRGIPIAGG
jgi:hypothetical protein